jgi:hypothetical protein
MAHGEISRHRLTIRMTVIIFPFRMTIIMQNMGSSGHRRQGCAATDASDAPMGWRRS